MKFDKPSSASSSSSISRKLYDPSQFAEHSADSQALKEAFSKIKLLENDYKALHDKRLQDVSTRINFIPVMPFLGARILA